MRGWKQRAERRRARQNADDGRTKIRAIRQAHLTGPVPGEAAPGAIEIPDPVQKPPLADDWQGLSWPELRAVAKQLRGRAVRTKDDAIQVIETADEAAFQGAFRSVTKRILHGADH